MTPKEFAQSALTLTSLIMAHGLAPATHAQSTNPPPAAVTSTNAPAKLPDVTVTADRVNEPNPYKPETLSSPKYTEPLRNIPQTITVVPRAVFEAQGATSLSEVLRNISGITLLAGEGGGASSTAGDSFFMRGFDASNSIFVDGVRNQGLITRDVFNLEQVEVFKGPTGSDTGRSTASGYVNLSTKVPRLEPLYSGSFGYGSANQKRGTLDLNQPLSNGKSESWVSKSALRLNGMWADGDVPGRDFVNRNSWSIAPSLGLGLETPTRVYFSTQHTRQDNLPDYGIPGRALNGSINRENFYGNPTLDFEDVSQDSYTARVEHDVNETLTLRNQTVYSETSRLAVITALGAATATNTVPRLRQINERINKIFSNQTSATAKFSTGPVDHAVVGGLELLREEQLTPTVAGAGTAPNASIFNPNPNDPITGYAPARTGAYSKGATDTLALYAFDTIELSKRWQLNGGVRWEHYQTDFRQASVAGAVTNSLSLSDSLLSGKAGLLFKPATNGSIYFSYGTTLTPPGGANFNLSAAAGNINNAATQPQESENFEVGTKWDFFQNRLSLNAALFRTLNMNEITADAANPGQFIYDRERMVQGVEFGVAGQVTERWQVLANFSYLNSDISEADNAAINGATLQWTPETSASLWTTYRLPIGLTIGGGVRYQGTVNRANAVALAGSVPQAPSYYVLDAMLQYDVNKHLTLRLNLNNLTDEFYPASLNNNGNRFNPGPPRTIMLTANFKF